MSSSALTAGGTALGYARGRWPLAPVVTAAVAGLVSLYLPWQAPNAPLRGGSALEGGKIDAWSPLVGAGEAAAVAAVLLCALALACFLRPQLLRRLPLGLNASCASYLLLAVAFGTRLQAGSAQPFSRLGFHYAAGSSVGIAAAIASLVGVLFARRPDLRPYWSVSRLAIAVPAAAFLVVLLLPWTQVGSVETTLGAAAAPGIAAAVLALVLVVYLPRLDPRVAAALAGAVLLFAAADLAAGPVSSAPALGAWLGVALAAVLALAALVSGLQGIRLPREVSPQLVLAASSALLVGSFFLPWETFTSDYGDLLTQNGWPSPASTASALLALLLVAVVAAPQKLPLPVGLLSAGIVLFVASQGLELLDLVGPRSGRLGSGALLGFVATALIAGQALWRLRGRPLAWRRQLAAALPIAVCLALLFFLLVPSWHVLPFGVETILGYALLSWLSVVEVLDALVLMALWSRELKLRAAQAWRIAVPLWLAGLAVVDLFRDGYDGTRWDHGAVIGFLALLVALGFIDARNGIERIRLPDVLRIDRL